MSLLSSVLQQISCHILTPVRNGSGLIPWAQCPNFLGLCIWVTQKSKAWSTHNLRPPALHTTAVVLALQPSTASTQESGSVGGEKTAETKLLSKLRAIDCLLFLPLKKEFTEQLWTWAICMFALVHGQVAI